MIEVRERLQPVGAEGTRKATRFEKEAIVMALIFPLIVLVGIVAGIIAQCFWSG